jgi:hypothetical protein
VEEPAKSSDGKIKNPTAPWLVCKIGKECPNCKKFKTSIEMATVVENAAKQNLHLCLEEVKAREQPSPTLAMDAISKIG